MTGNNKISIGGEFEISPKVLKNYWDFIPDPDSFFYSNGRSALMAILKFIAVNKPNIIYVPYYICPSVVIACKNVGFQVKFYELDEKFRFPLETLHDIEENAKLLTVNYFGFIDDNDTISKIKKKRKDIIFISDQVQSFWTFKNTIADYSFTSLRKHFATPDGAIVYSNNRDWSDRKDIKENTFYWPKLIASLLKNSKTDDEVYLKLFEDGERLADTYVGITKSSKFAQYLYSITNFDFIKEKRLKNTKTFYELGNKLGLNFMFDYSKDVVPLTVPILVKDRDEIRKQLFEKNLFLPIHWPLDEFNRKSKWTQKISTSELSIVIDQRYSEKEIIYQIESLELVLR